MTAASTPPRRSRPSRCCLGMLGLAQRWFAGPCWRVDRSPSSLQYVIFLYHKNYKLIIFLFNLRNSCALIFQIFHNVSIIFGIMRWTLSQKCRMKHTHCYNHYGNVRKRERNLRTNLEFSSEMSFMYMSEFFFLWNIYSRSDYRVNSPVECWILHVCSPFSRHSGNIVLLAKRTAVDFTDDKVKANRRYGASNKKLALPPFTYSGNVWVLPRATVYIPALMQASSAKTDRPNRCWRYAPLFPEKTSLT